MNWIVFLVASLLALMLEAGLDGLFRLGNVVPAMALILAVHVAWSAPRAVVPWAMLVLGFGQDMTHPFPAGQGGDLPLLGPGCLGYVAAGYVCLHLRPQLRRASPVAMVLMTMAAGIFMHLVVVAMVTARGLAFLTGEPVEGWNAPDELVTRFLSLLYTAVLAAPIGGLLERTNKLWRFSLNKGGPSRAGRLH